MRNKIFMYLFLFSVLLLLFMYINQKKIYEKQESNIVQLKEAINKLEIETERLKLDNEDLNYFTFQGNDQAMSYFEMQGYDARTVEETVSSQIYGQNTVSADNPLIPYVGMEGKMRINKVRFLNHKWLIADFTDGRHWGEMIIQYDIDKEKNLTLNTVSSLLYLEN